MKYYYFLIDECPLRILAKKKPSATNRTRTGTWVVREYDSEAGAWLVPSFPEITWGMLRKGVYIGSTTA